MNRGLQAEIKQTRGFATPAQEAVLNLQRTADFVSAGIAELLRSADLTFTQYNVLRILRGAGGEGLAAGEIGERMITPCPDVTRLVDRLQRRSLVSRSRARHDRRVVTIAIREEGLELLRRLDQPMLELHDLQVAHLGAEGLKTLTDLLEAIRNP